MSNSNSNSNNANFEALHGWWMEKAKAEADAVVPKAIEYGATDLYEIGRALHAVGVREVEKGDGAGDEERWMRESGVYFYVVGKMARWSDAMARGEFVSDDTLHDIGVYVRMVQRIRESGGWPGESAQQETPPPGGWPDVEKERF